MRRVVKKTYHFCISVLYAMLFPVVHVHTITMPFSYNTVLQPIRSRPRVDKMLYACVTLYRLFDQKGDVDSSSVKVYEQYMLKHYFIFCYKIACF